MIKSLTVKNHLGKISKYVFGEVEPESGFIVTDIKGLGPAKANINMNQLAASDGSKFNSGQLEGRNLVISGIFSYAPTIEDARLMSYKAFPTNKKVTITIETDNRIGTTEGYVESNEPDVFSKEESFEISILCESPFFIDDGPNGVKQTMFAGIEPLFQFPFGNPSLTEKQIVFSEIVTKKENTVYYEGDSETGILITIHALGTVGTMDIYNVKTREHMKIDMDKLEALTGSGMVAGDTIEICTVKRSRRVTLIRNGRKINALNILGKNPNWFTLSHGDNLFTFVAEDGEENLVFTIRSQTTFDGV